jgi:hypothetical protein
MAMQDPNNPKPRPDVTEPDIKDDPKDLPDYGDPPIEEPPKAPYTPNRAELPA